MGKRTPDGISLGKNQKKLSLTLCQPPPLLSEKNETLQLLYFPLKGRKASTFFTK